LHPQILNLKSDFLIRCMLTHLSISNYALIKELEIDFREGMTIITGETGAGKSILIGALSLILGQRADAQSLLDKQRKCVVEGTFSIKDYGLKDFFEQCELDYDDTTVIRREINPNGKSRAFINDTPVNLEQVKELGEMLVDVHSQHKTLTLQDARFQLAYIDAYVGHDKLLADFRNDFHYFNRLKSELAILSEKEKQSKADQDYYQFQFDELNAAKLEDGEQEAMEKELELLNHSEEIKSNLAKATDTLSSGEYSLMAMIKEVSNILVKAATLHPALEDISKRIEACHIEVKDIAGEIENAEQKIIYSPKRIAEINERLDTIYRLMQKHRLNSVKELIELKDSVAVKLDSISTLDTKIEELKKEITAREGKLNELSTLISKNRKKAKTQI